jgi:hypothetical protein
MLDIASVAPVAETPRKPTNQPQATIHQAQQQISRVRGDVAAIEASHHRAVSNRFKFILLRSTLCRHRGSPCGMVKLFSQNHFPRFATLMHCLRLRNPGKAMGASGRDEETAPFSRTKKHHLVGSANCHQSSTTTLQHPQAVGSNQFPAFQRRVRQSNIRPSIVPSATIQASLSSTGRLKAMSNGTPFRTRNRQSTRSGCLLSFPQWPKFQTGCGQSLH